MRVDVMAELPHYLDHIMPVFNALPSEIQGEVNGRKPRWRGERHEPDLTLIAGAQDARAMFPEPVVYVEHGAGQTYAGLETHSSHPGGNQPHNVIGFICPSQRVADAWGERFTVVAGCPKLDPFFRHPTKPESRTLGIMWRWDVPELGLCPEQRPATEHYHDMGAQVRRWKEQGWTVLGHGHPRAQVKLDTYWHNMGVQPVWDWAEVLSRSALIIGDNSSFLYEAAAIDRRVLCLNAPWYRRDVEHGLRFWRHAPGAEVNDMDQLAEFDIARYVDEDSGNERRRAAAAYAYAFLDEHASKRAADFILTLLADDRRKGVRWTARD